MISVYIRREYLEINVEGEYESIFIETQHNKKNIVVGEIYRIPDTNLRTSINRYDTIISKLTDTNKSSLLTNHLKYLPTYSQHLNITSSSPIFYYIFPISSRSHIINSLRRFTFTVLLSNNTSVLFDISSTTPRESRLLSRHHAKPNRAIVSETNQSAPPENIMSAAVTSATLIPTIPHGNLSGICHSVQVRSDAKSHINSQRYHES